MRRFWGLAFLFYFHIGTTLSAELLSTQDQEEILAKAQDFLGNLKTLNARIEQRNPDNTVSYGEFYLKRPHQMRLTYTVPQTLIIIANGGKLFCRENDQDALYDVSSTPASLLLQPTLDLKKDFQVVALSRREGNVALTLCRPGEGTGVTLTLIFQEGVKKPSPFKLVGWTIQDVQGNQTHVRLSNVRLGIQLDDNLFIWK